MRCAKPGMNTPHLHTVDMLDITQGCFQEANKTNRLKVGQMVLFEMDHSNPLEEVSERELVSLNLMAAVSYCVVHIYVGTSASVYKIRASYCIQTWTQ